MKIKPLTVGSTFYYEERKHHVVASFMDGEKLIYVLKYFGIHRRYWHYEVMEHWRLEMKLNYDIVTKVKHKRIKTED